MNKLIIYVQNGEIKSVCTNFECQYKILEATDTGEFKQVSNVYEPDAIYHSNDEFNEFWDNFTI